MVLRSLGFRLIPAPSLDPGEYGPPVPPMLAPLSPGRTRARGEAEKRQASPRPDSPFATLAKFRRPETKLGAGRR
jgi:hypothetical protein